LPPLKPHANAERKAVGKTLIEQNGAVKGRAMRPLTMPVIRIMFLLLGCIWAANSRYRPGEPPGHEARFFIFNPLLLFFFRYSRIIFNGGYRISGREGIAHIL